mmetsp:Transcript_18481/g.46131  ORF Transcript_18481/g.46131 Transcript_18481/m.46131 type:complete len:182 (-) Transcript_18481:288-833(-)
MSVGSRKRSSTPKVRPRSNTIAKGGANKELSDDAIPLFPKRSILSEPRMSSEHQGTAEAQKMSAGGWTSTAAATPFYRRHFYADFSADFYAALAFTFGCLLYFADAWLTFYDYLQISSEEEAAWAATLRHFAVLLPGSGLFVVGCFFWLYAVWPSAWSCRAGAAGEASSASAGEHHIAKKI